jgi:DNA-binding NarL/FixJ family response regulator
MPLSSKQRDRDDKTYYAELKLRVDSQAACVIDRIYAVESLSVRDRVILMLTDAGYHDVEVANALCVCRKTIHRVKQSIIQRVKERL